MNRSNFWKLIESSHPKENNSEQHIKNLAARLQEMKPEEIASFENHRRDLAIEMYDARLLEVMWILSGGGPGDEGWSLFTGWLILQGRKRYEQVLKTPEQLPELIPAGTDIYCEGVGISSLADTAYQKSTGRGDFYQFYEENYGPFQFPDNPKGAKQDPRLEDEQVLEKRLAKKYPDLWKYAGHFD